VRHRHLSISNQPEARSTVNATPELVALIQREREQSIEHDQLARIAACARACCSPSIADRLARVLRPATYPVVGGGCSC
jgi:hypothetical protein